VLYLNQHQARRTLSAPYHKYIIWGARVKRLAVSIVDILDIYAENQISARYRFIEKNTDIAILQIFKNIRVFILWLDHDTIKKVNKTILASIHCVPHSRFT
jgi:hypothetical protein